MHKALGLTPAPFKPNIFKNLAFQVYTLLLVLIFEESFDNSDNKDEQQCVFSPSV